MQFHIEYFKIISRTFTAKGKIKDSVSVKLMAKAADQTASDVDLRLADQRHYILMNAIKLEGDIQIIPFANDSFDRYLKELKQEIIRRMVGYQLTTSKQHPPRSKGAPGGLLLDTVIPFRLS